MLLKKLQIRNFRNIDCETIEFLPGVNCIIGKNAQGKSSVLEAIYFLSTGRSFRSTSISELIQHQKEYFYIEAEIEKNGITERLSIYYDGKRKKIEYNHNPFSQLTQLLGILPSVLAAPQDLQLIIGFPSVRRRFLNIHIAQHDPLYVYHLTRYFKAMKHRNALLKCKDEQSIFPFESQMAVSGKYIIEAREKGINEIKQDFMTSFASLCSKEHSTAVKYCPSCSVEDLKTVFQKNRSKEAILKCTLYGPHRDDFTLLLNDMPVKSFASEGQKRVVLSALRVAEWKRLNGKMNTSSLICVDDFGVHLDELKKALFLHLLKDLKQVVLTSPDVSLTDIPVDKKLVIENGKVLAH